MQNWRDLCVLKVICMSDGMAFYFAGERMDTFVFFGEICFAFSSLVERGGV